MVLEHALLHVRAGEEGAFEISLREALPLIESAPGCLGAEVRQQVENGAIYLLLVRWTSLDAHLAFRASELFASWRALTHSYYREIPTVSHFHEPVTR